MFSFSRFSCIVFLSGNVLAVEVEGRAPAGDNLEQSRSQALEDALKRAPQAISQGYTILGQWTENGVTTVRLYVGKMKEDIIRPRIALSQFHLIHPDPVVSSWASMLLEKLAARLEGSGKVALVDSGQYQLIPPGEIAPLQAIQEGTAARRLGATSNAELVFSVILWDLSQTEEQSWMPWKSSLRTNHIDMEVFIHEGLMGGLVEQRHITLSFSPEEGMTVILEDLLSWIGTVVTKRPLLSTILEVEGDLLYLDLPEESGLQNHMEVTLTPVNALRLVPGQMGTNADFARKFDTFSNTATVETRYEKETAIRVHGKGRFAAGDQVLVGIAPPAVLPSEGGI
ncbi:hypothetical protein CCP3SC1AL1_270005 [Gammaproteobacteria bacterium]